MTKTLCFAFCAVFGAACSGAVMSSDGGRGGGAPADGGGAATGGGEATGGGGEGGGGGGAMLDDAGCPIGGAGGGASVWPISLSGSALTALPDGGYSITLTEDGGVSLQIASSMMGFEDVIELSVGDAGLISVSPQSIRTAWCTATVPQGVTITGIPDSNTIADLTTLEIRAKASTYSIPVTVIDRDSTDQSIVANPTSLTIDELDAGTFQVRLGMPPTADVSVSATVNGSRIVTVSGAPLLFTPDNWSVPQTLTVTAGIDADQTDNSSQVALGIVDVPVTNVNVTTRDISIPAYEGWKGSGFGSDIGDAMVVAQRIPITKTTYASGLAVDMGSSDFGTLQMALYRGTILAPQTRIAESRFPGQSPSSTVTFPFDNGDLVLAPGDYWIAIWIDTSQPNGAMEVLSPNMTTVSGSAGAFPSCVMETGVSFGSWPLTINDSCPSSIDPLAVRIITNTVP